ncbi:MAG: type II secretion system major pseudopilin GspG [Gammaproteobacteria bacterium]|nr:type II secretion system major pseudopilin GspG [Gammaproteobacteria bacterium]
MKYSRTYQSGLTLLELIVVMVILGLLVGLIGPNLWARLHQSRIKTADMQIHLLESALDNYKLDVGRYPTTRQGLTALVQKPAAVHGWSGPYLQRGVPLDPWSHAYHYRSPGKHGRYDLWSDGGNGRNEITSWSTQHLQVGDQPGQ